MELKQLAWEYRQSAARLEERLKQLKGMLPPAGRKRDMDLEGRITLLQVERYQMLRIACYMEQYKVGREVSECQSSW